MTIQATNPWTFTLEDVSEAAICLKAGESIQWQPGDATNYELTLFRVGSQRFLIGTTVRFVLPLGGSRHPKYLMPYLPRGSWRGLRPLLIAAEWAVGSGNTVSLREQDRTDEAAWRRELTYSERDLHDRELVADARLGAMVRHEMETRGWQAP